MTALKENTYVDNIMKTGSDTDDLRKLKKKAPSFLRMPNSQSTSGNQTSRASKTKTCQTQVKYSDTSGINKKIH